MNLIVTLGLTALSLTFLPQAQASKPYPAGVYESAGGISHPNDDVVSRTPLVPGQEGVLVRVTWSLCGDDQACLLDAIELNLDSAQTLGLEVALAVGDGDLAPPAVKANCELFDFLFRGSPASMCLPWDPNYFAAKTALLNTLGQRFDDHPALAHVYFTGACSSNGFEGHCRIDEAEYSVAGYTPERLNQAYVDLIQAYLNAFPTTPITFEAHAVFDRVDHWESLWQSAEASGRVGAAAWWCAERLSLRSNETTLVWPLIQQIAASTYAVCQTVGNFSFQPWRFSDFILDPPLDYGTELSWDSTDSANAFLDTLDWVAGEAVHSGQSQLIIPFSAIEVWTADLNNSAFQATLATYLDGDNLYRDGFEQ